MKFRLFIELLDFTPDRVHLYSRGELIGDRELNGFLEIVRKLKTWKLK